MERIQNENCFTCDNVRNDVCLVFNESLKLYRFTTMKYGCNMYVKDVKKMVKLPKEYQFDSKAYILWDTQYSIGNAQVSQSVIADRIPKSDAKILMVSEDGKEPIYGIYVRKMMNGKNGEEA